MAFQLMCDISQDCWWFEWTCGEKWHRLCWRNCRLWLG